MSRRPGRPRSEEAHGAILDAAVQLIREVGYDALTMDAIASRAGVGKATVYRRWSTKETLAAEAVERVMRAIPVPDTGTVEGDLRRMMRDALGMYRDPSSGALLSGFVAAMARSELIAKAVRSGIVGVRREALRQVLERGVARGELRKGLDQELALDLLGGPLFYRFLITGGPVDERLARGVVDAVLRAFSPSPGPRRP
ncbi:TetR/AcrR family transcriptional regulator [Pyxidicoccus caerfyrddinensis]|uniref:TetR/AcrR family transcriptional regulator n=1 Tax=Pyxidicoccus caerfyrddinensis TaxID=2709663 RepID=UPI0013DA6282|nr:TetR/AcrR family transcriptional regulator [Pyxidicoccus caerfyrddinensis]